MIQYSCSFICTLIGTTALFWNQVALFCCLSCNFYGIVVYSFLLHTIMSIYSCTTSTFIPAHHYTVYLSLCLYPGAKCPAVLPGWPVPSISPGSVSLCTFSLVMLSEQEISHSIRLKRSHSTDKARAEGAPSPRCSICRLRLAPRLSTQDICISLLISSPFSLSLCSLPQTHRIL